MGTERQFGIGTDKRLRDDIAIDRIHRSESLSMLFEDKLEAADK